MTTLNLSQHPQLTIQEITQKFSKKWFIKNADGVMPLDVFATAYHMVSGAKGLFVQRAEVIYRVNGTQQDLKFVPAFIVSPHEEDLDSSIYGGIFVKEGREESLDSESVSLGLRTEEQELN